MCVCVCFMHWLFKQDKNLKIWPRNLKAKD